jgi:hypothetical protein
MRSLPIAPELELVDLALFLPQMRALAIADVHLGIEEAFRDEGVFVPRQHFPQVQHRLERIFQTLHVTPSELLHTIIINGDLRHRFGPLSRIEHRESKEFLRWLASWTEKIILIEGNHDGSLQRLASSQVAVTKSHQEGNCWFAHGDEALSSLPHFVGANGRSPLRRGKGGRALTWIVIGHEHPAIGLRDPVTERVEVYKCFLVGKFRGRNLLVLPSFNQLVRGSDLLKEQLLSPFVQQSRLEDFFVYPVSDNGQIYEFGPLHRLLAAV